MSRSRTVLFHPLNHIGLGHINRLAVIAHALHQLDQSIRTPFVVEETAHVFLDALGLPYVPLPSSVAMSERSAWAPWTVDEQSALQADIAQSILHALSPQIVVFDCLPSAALLDAVLAVGVRIVLCLREMRDMDGYLRHVRGWMEHVSLIVVPHEKGTISLPDELAAKSCFVGQVVRPRHAWSTKARDAKQPHAVISGGGGGYPRTVDFYNLAMQAIVELRKSYPEVKARLITGPLFGDWPHLQPSEGVTLIPFEPDTAATFAQSDLVICQAGYNTVAELEQLGTKTILVPAQRQWDDQFSRADRVSRERESFRVFRGNAARELAALAAEFLRDEMPRSTAAKSEGGDVAARLIHEMLSQETALYFRSTA